MADEVGAGEGDDEDDGAGEHGKRQWRERHIFEEAGGGHDEERVEDVDGVGALGEAGGEGV